MKRIGQFLTALIAPLMFSSKLQPFSLAENMAAGFINPHPNGRFVFFGRTNGADRKRRSNRLHLSRLKFMPKFLTRRFTFVIICAGLLLYDALMNVFK